MQEAGNWKMGEKTMVRKVRGSYEMPWLMGTAGSYMVNTRMRMYTESWELEAIGTRFKMIQE